MLFKEVAKFNVLFFHYLPKADMLLSDEIKSVPKLYDLDMRSHGIIARFLQFLNYYLWSEMYVEVVVIFKKHGENYNHNCMFLEVAVTKCHRLG